MKLSIKDILAKRAEIQQLSECLAFHGITPTMTVLDIFKHLRLNPKSVLIQNLGQGLKCFISKPRGAHSKAYRIFIDKSVVKELGKPSKKNNAYLTFVNLALSHELAHVILGTPPIILDVDKASEKLDNSSPYLEGMRAWMKYNGFYNTVELSVESLAMAIVFRDQQRFINKQYEYKMDLKMVANDFNAPVDCTIKWVLSRMPIYDFHYFKYNIQDQIIEDYYTPLSYSSFDHVQVISDVKSVANKAISKNSSFKGFSKINGKKFYCYAYYIKNKNKLTVIGFLKTTYDSI